MKINKQIGIRLIILVAIVLIYPYYKFRSTNHFIELVDALTIEGLVLFAMGLIKRLMDSGAFSAISYTAQRKFFKYPKDYNAYIQDTKTQISFNYTLWLGVISIVLSFILSFLV